MRELKYSLDQVREGMREKIRIAYNEQFDYLEKVAKEQNVSPSILPNRDSIITVKTTPDNILVLQNNANTDAFYQEQIGKILDATKPATPPTPPTPGPNPTPNPNPVPATPAKKIRKASLQTRTSIPLSTEEDIDHYLEGLREQLLKLMVDSDGVMIIK